MAKEDMILDKLTQIFKDCIFEELTQDNYDSLILDNLPVNTAFEYWDGCTKVVFHFDNDDFVVKIPFCGESDYDYEEDETKCYFFCGARDGEDNWNYCEAERRNYKAAVQSCVSEFFAETKFIGFINDHPFYIQELVNPGIASRDLDDNTYCTIGNMIAEADLTDKPSYTWVADAINYYGTELVKCLIQFLADQDITDLHNANLAYTHNGVPIIMDYAGYAE